MTLPFLNKEMLQPPSSTWVDPNQPEIRITEYLSKSKLDKIIKCESWVVSELKRIRMDKGEKEDFNFTTIKALSKLVREDGSYVATYKKSRRAMEWSGEGRCFAEGSLGLQTIPKAIRGFIADDHNIDVDMENAHPSIIYGIMNREGVLTPNLQSYITNRDTVLRNVCAELVCDRGTAKVKILTVLNGGACPKGSKTLKDIKKELTNVATSFDTLQLSSRFRAEIESQPKKRGQAPVLHRMMIAHVNSVENEILWFAWNYLHNLGFTPSTLQFDGFFVKQIDADTKALLVSKFYDLTQAINTRYGIHIEWALKDMDNTFKIDEMVEDADIVVPPVSDETIDLDDEYDWYDFIKRFTKPFKSLNDLHAYLNVNAPRVVAYVTSGKGVFIKKDNLEELNVFCARFGLDTYVNVDGKNMSLTPFIKEKCCYSDIVFKPTTLKNKKREKKFNMWRGFKGAVVPDCDFDDKWLKVILNHIYEVWAFSNMGYFEYIMSWFGYLISHPDDKPPSCLILRGKQGSGKNTVTNFIADFVLGRRIVAEDKGLESILGSFNGILSGKKLFIANEIAQVRSNGAAHCDFDKLKTIISEDTLQIHRKGLEKITINNCVGYILFTNHLWSLVMEKGDRRLAAFETSDKYCGDLEYHDRLHSSDVFNQRVGNIFFTYLLEKAGKIDLRRIPETGLRVSLKEANRSSLEDFMIKFKEDLEGVDFKGEGMTKCESEMGVEDEKWCPYEKKAKYVTHIVERSEGKLHVTVPSMFFFNKYNEWCKTTNTKLSSCTVFVINMKDKFGAENGRVYIGGRQTRILKFYL